MRYVTVATNDTGGALFMTEQPIDRRGFGLPNRETLQREYGS